MALRGGGAREVLGLRGGRMICRREGPGVEMAGLGLKGRGLKSTVGGEQGFV